MNIWKWNKSKKFYQNPRFWTIAIVSLLVIGIAAPFAANPSLDSGDSKSSEQTRDVDVPDLVGKNAEDACKELDNIKLKCDVKSDDGRAVVVKKNWTIISQDPSAQTSLKEGETVKLIANKPSSDDDDVDSEDKNQQVTTVDKQANIDKLNSYFTDVYQKESIDVGDSRSIKLGSVMIGFKLNGDDILVVVSNNRMKAEGFSAQDLTQFGTTVLYSYPQEDELKFGNFNSSDQQKMTLSKYDIYYED